MNLNIGEKSAKGEPKMREMEQIKMNQDGKGIVEPE